MIKVVVVAVRWHTRSELRDLACDKDPLDERATSRTHEHHVLLGRMILHDRTA